MSPRVLPSAARAHQFAEMEPAMIARSIGKAFAKSVFVLLAAASVTSSAHAVTFTWTNAAGGSWDTASNWNSGAGPVADGAANVADFNTINPTGDITVTLA